MSAEELLAVRVMDGVLHRRWPVGTFVVPVYFDPMGALDVPEKDKLRHAIKRIHDDFYRVDSNSGNDPRPGFVEHFRIRWRLVKRLIALEAK